ncbi:unnamed protein product [Hymenolepis diminuta]|uniref:Secreted protein n=1 Tax=Hymenolepis diminuta TaxID=6216 RepID=A0A0R3SUE8_HYMDI|nr:unnamed protein product [Hymenolepis diminuta]
MPVWDCGDPKLVYFVVVIIDYDIVFPVEALATSGFCLILFRLARLSCMTDACICDQSCFFPCSKLESPTMKGSSLESSGSAGRNYSASNSVSEVIVVEDESSLFVSVGFGPVLSLSCG